MIQNWTPCFPRKKIPGQSRTSFSKNAGPQAKKPLIVRLLPYASVAAALVLCAAVLLPTLNREAVPGEIEPDDLVVHVDHPETPENPKNPYEEQSNPTIPDDPEIPEDPELPTWYQPGQFTLVSVLRNADSPVLTAASPANEGLFRFCANTNVQGNMLNKFEYIVNARFVAGDNTFTTTSEHRGHKGLFYDVEAGKPVCYSCLVKEILGDDTLDVGVEPITNERYVSCYLYDKRVTRRFLVDLETEKVVEMPVLSYNDVETFTVSYDGRFAVTHAEQTDSPYEAVYLIDTASGTYKQINQGQPCFFQSTFSPDSQNVLTLLSNDGETNYLTSERCIFRLYNVSNGAECTCYGKVVSFEGDLLVTKKRPHLPRV